jgi:hypothetical protein
MSEAEQPKRVTQIAPYVLAMVACDYVYQDPHSGKKTIIGTFSNIMTQVLPVTVPLAIYLVMTDGRGKVPFRLQMIDADEEHDPIMKVEGDFPFDDPRAVAEFVMNVPSVTFPTAGEYRIQLFACHELQMERRILVITPESPDERTEPE